MSLHYRSELTGIFKISEHLKTKQKKQDSLLPDYMTSKGGHFLEFMF